MNYVYLLKHVRSNAVYVGYSNDLMRRINEHQKTKKDWKLVYYEAYLSSQDARKRERMLKSHGSSLGHLKKRVEESIRKSGMLNINTTRSARR